MQGPGEVKSSSEAWPVEWDPAKAGNNEAGRTGGQNNWRKLEASCRTCRKNQDSVRVEVSHPAEAEDTAGGASRKPDRPGKLEDKASSESWRSAASEG